MNQGSDQGADQGPSRSSAGRDGLAAVAIILLTVVLIAVVVNALVS